MEKSIIIIGAGIAGLCTGCYARMNGYKTQIFEMHTIPGGLCTSWKRKGYKIDGCIHWLTGSSPGNSFYRLWEEVGAVQGCNMVDPESFIRIEGEQGKAFNVYSDIDRLEQHMKDLAPEDKDVIEEFIKPAITGTHYLNVPIEKAPELFSPIEGLKMMISMFPYLRLMRKWGKISIHDFAQRFKNPFLREVFPLILNFPDTPMSSIIFTLSLLHKKAAGYPLGGSLEFARGIERRYLDLGGEVYYKSPVVKILVKNDKAVGVRLADGSEYRSDIIISAADGRTTVFDMLEGKYVNEEIKGYYDTLPIYTPVIYLALGVARSFDEPHSAAGINFLLDEPVTIAGREWKRLQVHIFNFDPTLAPEGKTLLTLMIESNYDYWKNFYENPETYKAEKERIADVVIAALDRRYPGLADQVEMCDVATPITFERYTGNWQGTYEGWLNTTKTYNIRMSRSLPGLSNFYMAGQWIQPGGGLPTGVMTGRHVIQIICKNDKKPFVTSTP